MGRCRLGAALPVVVALLVVGAQALPGGQIPKPADLTSLEEGLAGIGTDASSETLQAIKDARIFTPTALRNVLTALAKAAGTVPGVAGNPTQWLVLQPHAHRLVAYLRVKGLNDALDTLRSLLQSSPSAAGLASSVKDLVRFAGEFDPADFLLWATADDAAQDKGATSDTAPTDSSGTRRTRPASPKAAPKAKRASPKRSPSRPKPTVGPSKGASPRKPSASPKHTVSKPKPIGNDPKDPLDQLYDWSRRAKTLGGSVRFLREGEARRRRSRSLLTLDGDSEPGATAAADGGHAAVARQLRGTPAPNPNLNVGYSWFKPRNIGVVFHMMQFRDKRKYLYPPQAYWNGDDPAKRLLAAVNKVFRYSGVNVQFYLKDYRINVDMHPYLVIGNVSDWQDCGNAQIDCGCFLASKNNFQGEKYMNIYVIGSQAYRGYNTTASATASSNPGRIDLCEWTRSGPLDIPTYKWNQKYTPPSQNVWMSFDYLDPLQYNSAEFWNLGGTTLAHEFGHMLGLRHTFPVSGFVPDSQLCKDSDDVADTPPDRQGAWQDTDSVYLELSETCRAMVRTGKLPKRAQLTKFDSCPGDGYIDNVFNLMNYVPSACGLLLTKGQVRSLQKRTQKYQTHLGDW